MSAMPPRRHVNKTLVAALDAYQAAHVIPHCAVCSKPCCKLDVLVLELAWKQVKVFWRLDESRAAFDKLLATGKGPEEIRAGNGLYYVHSKACPAYDEAGHSCTVYDQPIKPVGCTDFPLYLDEDCVIADLRCEALEIKALSESLGRSLGPDFRVQHSADEEFPFLVTLSVKAAAKRKRRD